MKFYKLKTASRLNIGFAIVWLVLFLINLLSFRDVFQIVSTGLFALIYGLTVYSDKKNEILELTDSCIISRINIIKRELQWKDVTSKKYFAGEWKLTGKVKTITIAKDLFSAEDWIKINEFISEKNIV